MEPGELDVGECVEISSSTGPGVDLAAIVQNSSEYGIKQMADPNQFIASIGKFFNNPLLSDVILKVGDKTYHAHKLILVCHSEVFGTMLAPDGQWQESRSGQVQLTERPECQLVFSDFLQFLYTNHVRISDHNVIALRTLADKYMVGRLSRLCLGHMCREMNCENVVGWDQYAATFGLRELGRHCQLFMHHNMDLLVESQAFLELSRPQLAALLASSDLVVAEELTLHQAVKDWVHAYDRSHSPERVKGHYAALLPLVRFPMMSGDQLNEIEEDSAVLEVYPELRHQINCCYKFLATAIPAPQWTCSLMMPRHYHHGYSCHFVVPGYSRRSQWTSSQYAQHFTGFSSNSPCRTQSWKWFVTVTTGNRALAATQTPQEPILEISNPGIVLEERAVMVEVVFFGRRNGGVFKKVCHSQYLYIKDFDFHPIRTFSQTLPQEFVVDDTLTFQVIIKPTDRYDVKI